MQPRVVVIFTLPETAYSPLKIDGWKMNFPFWGLLGLFSGTKCYFLGGYILVTDPYNPPFATWVYGRYTHCSKGGEAKDLRD